jgi:threonine dehydrogenase-like Zn-dependent dehydrogenase
VRTECSGISGGTELLAYRGELDPDMPLDETLGTLAGTFSYPFEYGYSCVGVIERSRTDVLPEGARVFAFHPHRGALVSRPTDLVRMDGAEPRLATMFPLVETALQVSLDAGAVNEEAVAVAGLGPVGILSALLLQRGGARVIGAEPREWRRKVAGGLGLRAVAPEELRNEVALETGDRGVPLVVESSGAPGTLAQVLPLLAPEGTALVASWYGTRAVSLPLGAEFHRRRLTIRSTQVSTIPAALLDRWTVSRRRAAARELMDELPLASLATHEFPIGEAPAAYQALDRGDEGLLHVALRYR